MAATLLLAWAGSALADDGRKPSARALAKDRAMSSVAAQATPAVRSLLGRSTFSVTGNFISASHHDGSDLHLPPTQQNIELVGELEMDTPADLRTPETADEPVLPGQIADLAIHKNFAYLNSWDEPSCKRGGTFVVDITNPATPQQVGFIRAKENSYHGEGAHVITLDTPSFQGDVLAVNNEPYSASACGLDSSRHGGFDLYDVTNPRAPRTLVQGVGDTGPDDGSLVGSEETPNSSHSTFMWQGNDRRAYVVFVDNIEFHDVDIFEITDPANPKPVAEFDFVEEAAEQGVDIIDNGGLQGPAEVFLHDMVVKKIGDRFIMKADYWDAGYTTWDVTNPADPQYIGDSHYDDPDSLTGWSPQEGNGHQGEFSFDNRYILAADEDFSPFRPDFEITSGPNAREYQAAPVGGAASPDFLEDGRLNGPTVYGGYGCPGTSDPIPPRATHFPPGELEEGEEAIVVLQRGPSGDPDNPEEACFPGEKAENGINAGYDAVVLVNHHFGGSGAYCGSGAFPAAPPIVTVCTTHEALHRMFDEEPNDPGDPYEPGHGPPIGTEGAEVASEAVFDGWGYARLIENTPGKMREIDAHAIEEALNPAFSVGFGDLSIHEFATDPDKNIAYASYYAGGMRVFTFGEGGLTEQGRFIDDEGSNFWGVEQFTTTQGDRLFAGSDRDFGLQIFRYTGPSGEPPGGGNQRPVCKDSTVMVPFKGSANVPLRCSDDEGAALRRTIVAGPGAGRLAGDANTGAVTYEHTGTGLGAVDSFTFKANDGIDDSDVATVSVVVGARDGGPCFNPFTGTAASESTTGSPFGDIIRGGDGNDVLEGQGGDDCLFGETGRDQLDGDTGNDRLEGGALKDRLFGGSGRDTMLGGSGNDHIRGSSGNDRAQGGSGVDRVDGGSNADRLRGGRGNDRMRGGPGRDRVFGQRGRDRLEAGDGRRNLLSGGSGRDRLFAVNGKRDTVRCGGGRDIVQADRRDRVADDCESVRRTRPRN